MKSKIIVNILVVYFFILSFVLLIQVTSKETNAVEPLTSEITVEDKLKNSIIFSINSPIMFVNEKQVFIDKRDTTITPIIQEGKVYIPVTLLQTAFNANISFSVYKKETTVRLNNKAIVFYNDANKITVIDINSEEKLELDSNSKIIDDRFYIPLRTFAEIFDKEIFSYKNLIILSNIENIFDPMEEINIIEEILHRVDYLPIIGNEENLKNLIYKNKPNKFSNNSSNLLTNNLESINQFDINDANSKENTTLEEQKHYVKTIENFNFYINNNFLEIFIKQDENEEFAFSIELFNANLADIILKGNKLILTYSSNYKESNQEDFSTTIIYDITDTNNVKQISLISNNGVFYQNIINGKYLYTLSYLDATKANKDKTNMLPLFEIKQYNSDIIKGYNHSYNLKEIYYFPDVNDNNYTLISIFDLEDLEKEVKSYAFFGMGKNFVIDEQYLYIATSSNGKSNFYLFEIDLAEFEFINRISLNGEILEPKDFIIFNDDNSLTLKTDKEQKVYTKELKEME